MLIGCWRDRMGSEINVIRARNIADIKKYLFKVGSAVASEIGVETDVSMVTVHSIIKDLLKEGSITEGENVQKGVGRPALEYKFNYDYQTSLLVSVIWKPKKVDLQFVGEVVNLSGEVQAHMTKDLEENTIEEFLQFFDEFYSQFPNVDNIGVMIPGKIHKGVVLSGWTDGHRGWKMEETLFKRTGKPIFIQNDAHLITVGYCINENIPTSEMIVGIFHPSAGKPGITIYTNEHLIEGKDSLAGEGKFLPQYMYGEPSKSYDEVVEHLLNILPFYNVALAPHRFILSIDSMSKNKVLTPIQENQVLKDQINHPKFEYIQNFFPMSRMGLRWLINRNTPYEL